MLSALFAVLFGVSLLPGRKPLCLRFAERISDGIMPEGAVPYCRRLTWIWFAELLVLTGFNALMWMVPSVPLALRLASFAVPLAVIVLTFAVERRVRDRRFRVVFHTSGSTGESKTIVKTFEMLAQEVACHRAFYRDLKPTVFLGTVQWDHMLGMLWMDLLPKAMGVPADTAIIRSPEELLAKMRAAERVFLVTTPSFLDRFTTYADQYEVPQNCVEIITSGALLTQAVSERTRRTFGVEPRQIFGSTETGGVAWRRGGGDFIVFDDVRVWLEDAHLTVKSPYSFARHYVMGDGAELSADGRHFALLGRMDRLVKVNEVRVNLAEMEEKIRTLGFRDCALVKLAGAYGDCLGAVLVPPPGVTPTTLELRQRLLPVFPTGTVPRKFRLVGFIPKNTQGKVLQSELAKMF